MSVRFAIPVLGAALVVGAAAPARGEILEEIVAWVNGDIITRSELDAEEEVMMAEAYRRFTGAELDQRVEQLRDSMLIDMIDRKILLQHARMLFKDLDEVKRIYYEGFKDSQNLHDDAELERLLAQEGMTVDQFKERLLEMYAPEEVLRVEVRDRISVSDAEVEEYYRNNPAEFRIDDELNVREIVLLADTPEQRAARRAEAEAAVARIRGGEDFAAVAAEVSEAGTAERGGLLGAVGRGDLAGPLESAAFALEPGQVSDPIETAHGFHILGVDQRRVGESKSLDEVREAVHDFLVQRKYQSRLREFLSEARAEAEWCVKEKFADRLPDGVSNPPCEAAAIGL